MKHNNYALLYTSSQLRTLVRKIPNPNGIKSMPLSDAGCVLMGSITDFTDDLFADKLLKLPFLYEAADSHPLLYSVEGRFAYAMLRLGDAFVSIGPLRFDSPIYMKHVVTFQQLELDNLPEDFEDWIKSVPQVSFDSLISILLLLINDSRQGTADSPFYQKEEIIHRNCVDEATVENRHVNLADAMFEQAEDGFIHNPYNHEVRECHCIETGDVDGLTRVLSEEFTGRYGTLGFDPIRQAINIGIVTITIASRAAIRGGLHYEEAFYISDISIQQMEKCHDVETIKRIYLDAEFQYCRLVAELKSAIPKDSNIPENRHISHCKDYIFTHLHGKITVQEIAGAIGLDANYLSALFKRQEHITLKDFILREKVKLVKNLLTYSNYSYIKIATYLGFSSQSHLGREFKKETNMTLRQYRELYAKEDFARDIMMNE